MPGLIVPYSSPLVFTKAILFLWGHVTVSDYDLIVIREGGVLNI